jgi:tRNA-splicing ligase RtcB
MKFVNTEHKIPIKSWCENVESSALNQAINLANHPTAFHHIALMPDCHVGVKMPIGGVMACENAILPDAVGVDIGCGMGTVQLSATSDVISEDKIKRIMGELRRLIPVGFNHHLGKQEWDGFDAFKEIGCIDHHLINDAKYQLGTLGGGNHFVEIQKGDDNHIWLMLHSGSRNFGFKIANYYSHLADEMCEKWHVTISDLNNEKSPSFFPFDDPLGSEYFEAMTYALWFAEENRKRMMQHFINISCGVFQCEPLQTINIHHNFASLEHHFGRNVVIHRKGATCAREGMLGIIPGSMGTNSYIVKGSGNKESFESCSHGAGRIMGRKEFCRTHTLEECDKAMEGIVFGRRNKDRKGNLDISEAPQAYKNIDEVIESELDLIDVVTKLTPLGVLKG